MINWKENAKSNFEGSVSIEVDSCSLSLYPITSASKNNLVVLIFHLYVHLIFCIYCTLFFQIAQIVTGSALSPLNDLWKQLLLLNEYLNIIEEYKKSVSFDYVPCLQFPDNFTNPHKEVS